MSLFLITGKRRWWSVPALHRWASGLRLGRALRRPSAAQAQPCSSASPTGPGGSASLISPQPRVRKFSKSVGCSGKKTLGLQPWSPPTRILWSLNSETFQSLAQRKRRKIISWWLRFCLNEAVNELMIRHGNLVNSLQVCFLRESFREVPLSVGLFIFLVFLLKMGLNFSLFTFWVWTVALSPFLQCLPIILDNKLSHPLLEQLLPALKYCLHDNSEKVRVAFVDMLLKVKAVRAAKVGQQAFSWLSHEIATCICFHPRKDKAVLILSVRDHTPSQVTSGISPSCLFIPLCLFCQCMLLFDRQELNNPHLKLCFYHMHESFCWNI